MKKTSEFITNVDFVRAVNGRPSVAPIRPTLPIVDLQNPTLLLRTELAPLGAGDGVLGASNVNGRYDPYTLFSASTTSVKNGTGDYTIGFHGQAVHLGFNHASNQQIKCETNFEWTALREIRAIGSWVLAEDLWHIQVDFQCYNMAIAVPVLVDAPTFWFELSVYNTDI